MGQRDVTTIHVTKDDAGKLVGAFEEDKEPWIRFVSMTKDMEAGELFEFSYRFPRNPKFHNLHMRMVRDLFENQELVLKFDLFREWVTVGAGYSDNVPGPHGKTITIPRSIAFDKMDDVEFEAYHQAVKGFMRSTECTRPLWPRSPDHEAAESIEQIIEKYERQR